MSEYYDFYILHNPLTGLYRVKRLETKAPEWSPKIIARCFYDSKKQALRARTNLINRNSGLGKPPFVLNLIHMRLKRINGD